MAKLNILRYPDPKLHTVARPVGAVDERIRQLVDDMLETMYAAEGIGLAATQVDVHERVIVIDVSDERSRPLVLINPELLQTSEEMVQGEAQMKVVKKKRMVAVTVTGRRCPTCARTFPPNVNVCPHDGTKLEAVTAEAPNAPPSGGQPAPPAQATATERVCSACGRRYTSGERFCGVEGAPVVEAPRRG